jgi:hypothetical protein
MIISTQATRRAAKANSTLGSCRRISRPDGTAVSADAEYRDWEGLLGGGGGEGEDMGGGAGDGGRRSVLREAERRIRGGGRAVWKRCDVDGADRMAAVRAYLLPFVLSGPKRTCTALYGTGEFP